MYSCGVRPLRGPEALDDVGGRDEVGEMAAKLIVGFGAEAFNRFILDRSVHALDPAGGPGMLGLGEEMVDVGLGVGVFEGMGSEELLTCDQPLDLGSRPPRAMGISEVQSAVGKRGTDFAGNGDDQV